MAQLLGLKLEEYTQGKMTYDLRRLRLHGLIERIAGSHHYRLKALGLMASQFYTRFYTRALWSTFSCELDNAIKQPP